LSFTRLDLRRINETLSTRSQIPHTDNGACLRARHGGDESALAAGRSAASNGSNVLRSGGAERTNARATDEIGAKQDAVSRLSTMLTTQVPQLRDATVLVDSPRWPGDLDCSSKGVVNAEKPRAGRGIDVALRAFASDLRSLGANKSLSPLSMFPTPPLRYFVAQLNRATCKPHLRELGRALFGGALDVESGPATGGIFTRFMIAGFAAYRALAAIGADTYECYPDLQFRLWCGRRRLPAKNGAGRNARALAMAARLRVVRALARDLGVAGVRCLGRLDEADAAILALSTAVAIGHGAIMVFNQPGEGRFLVAIDRPDAERLDIL
jgi:hypothetical protein